MLSTSIDALKWRNSPIGALHSPRRWSAASCPVPQQQQPVIYRWWPQLGPLEVLWIAVQGAGATRLWRLRHLAGRWEPVRLACACSSYHCFAAC